MIAADFMLRSLGYNDDFTVQLGASVRKLRGRSFTVTGCVSPIQDTADNHDRWPVSVYLDQIKPPLPSPPAA
jgi:hypothetical protein